MPIEILENRIAPAAILVVNTADSGQGSLRDAINAANSNGDNILFANGLHGTIALKSPLPTISTSMTIGGTTKYSITIDGRNTNQIFSIFSPISPIDVNLIGMTLTRGSSSGGGGALYVSDYTGIVGISGCVFSKNQAPGGPGLTNGLGLGGAIDLQVGTLEITKSIISGNVAVGSPGGFISPNGGNAAGGGIYVAHGTTLLVSNTIISANKAQGGNGFTGASTGGS